MGTTPLSEGDRARIRAEEEFRYEIRRNRHLKRLLIVFACAVIGFAALVVRSSFSSSEAKDATITSTVQVGATGSFKELIADSICGRDEFQMDQLREMANDGIVQLLREEAVRMAKAHEAIALCAGTSVRVEYEIHSYSRVTPISGPYAGTSACLVPSDLVR